MFGWLAVGRVEFEAEVAARATATRARRKSRGRDMLENELVDG